MVRGAYTCGNYDDVANTLACYNDCSTISQCGGGGGCGSGGSTGGGCGGGGYNSQPGVDSDTAPGLTVPAGTSLTFTYYVTDTGKTDLNVATIIDDNATPNNPADDFNPTPVMSGRYNVGDTNHDGILEAGETWVYTATGTATLGTHDNTATVTATPVDAKGNTLGANVTASALGVLDRHAAAREPVGLCLL